MRHGRPDSQDEPVVATTTSAPPCGWYPDPSGTPWLRWFDGTRWTDAVTPIQNMPQPLPQATSKPWYTAEVPFTIKVAFATLVVVVVLSLILPTLG